MYSAPEGLGKNDGVLSGKGTRIPGRACFRTAYAQRGRFMGGYQLEAFIMPKGL